MKIESLDQDVRSLLTSGYYKIPRFQRPYSWDKDNIQDFWNDVIQEEKSEYFIGSMVVYKEDKQRYGIVDGQQRLTTITILLCALRNKLDQENLSDLAAGIHGLIERNNINNKAEYVLSTESSYPYFQHSIQNRSPSDIEVDPLAEETNLKIAYELLSDLLGQVVDAISQDPSLSEPKRKKQIERKLTQIRDSILNLKLILIKLDDEDDAYVIFETLNTRGKDLSLTDLLKNLLAKNSKGKNAANDSLKIKWKQFLEIIQASSAGLNTDSFIHHLWLSRYEYLPAKKLFPKLKKKITASSAKDFLNNLLSDSKLYRSIHEVSYGKWTKDEQGIKDALVALQIFNVEQQTPSVLSIIRAYKDTKNLKKKPAEEILSSIEKFHFQFTAITSQRSSGGISAMYAAIGRRLSEAKDGNQVANTLKDLKKKLIERTPSKEQFLALFPEVIYTETVSRQKKLVKYILSRIHAAENVGSITDYEQMTIEHLLPQSEVGKAGITDDIVGQIGNLILVPAKLNSELEDKSFTEKKAILKKNKVLLPKAILSQEKWSADEIKERTSVLASAAYDKLWKI